MTFHEFKKNDITYGHFFETSNYYAFFGKKIFTKETLDIFPIFKFQNLKQIHSDILLETTLESPEAREADAHYTSEKNLALLVQTADCIPLLVFEKSSHKIASIHAGWRGIQKRIIPETLLKLSKGVVRPHFDLFLGPCIHQNSFEVDKDVCDLLIQSTLRPNAYFSYDESKHKYFVDLIGIAQKQILETQIPNTFYNFNKDTFTDLSYSSFRREKSPCRNWSFILKK